MSNSNNTTREEEEKDKLFCCCCDATAEAEVDLVRVIEEEYAKVRAALRAVNERMEQLQASLASFERARVARALEQAETDEGDLAPIDVALEIHHLDDDPERKQRLIALFCERYGATAFDDCCAMLNV